MTAKQTLLSIGIVGTCLVGFSACKPNDSQENSSRVQSVLDDIRTPDQLAALGETPKNDLGIDVSTFTQEPQYYAAMDKLNEAMNTIASNNPQPLSDEKYLNYLEVKTFVLRAGTEFALTLTPERRANFLRNLNASFAGTLPTSEGE